MTGSSRKKKNCKANDFTSYVEKEIKRQKDPSGVHEIY